MTGRRLAAVDAQTYWMSARIPSDQFLLYGFDGRPADLRGAIAAIRDRAQGCPELTLRVQDRNPLAYPLWVGGPVDDRQFATHDLDDSSWAGCLSAVGRLADDQLDARVMTWRLHVFSHVDDVPAAMGAGTVVVLQVAHALGDGVRSSELAALLLGRAEPVAAVATPRLASLALPWRACQAACAHRRLVRDTDAGLVPPPGDSRPALHTNARPAGARGVRTIIRRRSELPGPTVTIGVLAAVADALAGHLTELGENPATLGAEVPMAKAVARQAHNHFGNVGVGLYPELGFDARASRIFDELNERRHRARHPATRAGSRAFAAIPAPLLRWGVSQFDPNIRSPTVTGNTVVSSVNRGPADLRLGDAPVVVTAGFPALSPMMGLTHGVHGIGGTVAISVHAAESAIGDIDGYVRRLEAAL